MKRQTDIPLADIGLRQESAAVSICDHPGCTADGDFRAPRKPSLNRRKIGLNDPVGVGYHRFCLEHVREYNRDWNYFEGWSDAEIEEFRRQSVTGHRPTWRLGSGPGAAFARPLDDEFFDLSGKNSTFAGGLGGQGRRAGSGGQKPGNEMGRKLRRALGILDLNSTASLQEIKMRYKQLVKRFHPDVNGGDKQAEERFKKINEAYECLLSSGFY